jgi:hypothetical protein
VWVSLVLGQHPLLPFADHLVEVIRLRASVVGRFIEGEIDVTEIVPGIERAVFRSTVAYDANPARQLEPR